jgi:hypothetical protein
MRLSTTRAGPATFAAGLATMPAAAAARATFPALATFALLVYAAPASATSGSFEVARLPGSTLPAVAAARATFAALATFALLVHAAPASATSGSFEVARLPGSTLPERTIPAVSGPLPAGDGIVFAVGGPDGGATLRLVAPGAGTRDVATIAPKAGASLTLLASPTRLVALRFASACEDCKYQVYRTTLEAVLAGPLGGPLATIAQCEEGQPCAASFFCTGGQPRFSAALGGDLLGVRDTCSQTATVTNLANGASRALGKTAVLAVAGPYVATAEPGLPGAGTRLVVRDVTTGAEVYRAGPLLESRFPAPRIALLPDGTVVYASAVPGKRAIVVASPPAPAGRVLRYVTSGVAVAGVGSGLVLLTSPGPAAELVRLDGAAVPAGTLAIPDLLGVPAFDGRTIAWAQRACVTTTITSWTLGDPRPAPPDLRCPTPLPSRAAVTMSRSRRLGVELACPASTRGGCLASVRLTAMRRGRLPRGVNGAERSYRLGIVRVALDPRTLGRAELLVPPGAARWVRRHARLRLGIDVRSDREQAAQRPVGDPGRARGTVALSAAR